MPTSPKKSSFRSMAAALGVPVDSPFKYQDQEIMELMKLAKANPHITATIHAARQLQDPVILASDPRRYLGKPLQLVQGAYNPRNPPQVPDITVAMGDRGELLEEAPQWTLAHELGHHIHQNAMRYNDALLPDIRGYENSAQLRELGEQVADSFENPVKGGFTPGPMADVKKRTDKYLRRAGTAHRSTMDTVYAPSHERKKWSKDQTNFEKVKANVDARKRKRAEAQSSREPKNYSEAR